jgi:NADPH:quinone reductase-like Zn-dependent oxidoreductase
MQMANSMQRWAMEEAGRKSLKLVDAAVPTPKPHEILVKVGAVSLNYHDKMVIEGLLPFPGKGFTPGSDMAGTVVAAGSEVRRFKSGERVIATYVPNWIDGDDFSAVRGTLGEAHPGVLAQYIAIDAEWAVRAPDTASDVEASTLPCAGLTAWFALVEKGKVFAGQTVLVHGTGGVAIWGLQIAVAHGATVLVTSGDNAKLTRAIQLGARHGINRTDGDWVETVKKLTGGRGVNHVLETIGGPHLGRSLEAAADAGRVSMIGVFEGFTFSGGFPALARKHLKIEGIGVGHRRGLEDLVRAVDAAAIKPAIDACYPLAELQSALSHLDRGPFGKVVVTL